MPYLMRDGAPAFTPESVTCPLPQMGRWLITAPSPKVTAHARSKATWAETMDYSGDPRKRRRKRRVRSRDPFNRGPR